MTGKTTRFSQEPKRPYLFFPESSGAEGFANSTVSHNKVSNIAEIVRELIQNCTDASREAGRKITYVKFVLDKLPVSEIPGIDNYKSALKQARDTHRESLESSVAILERIDKMLGMDEVPVLNVIDNGIGLNLERMHSLLGNGLTSKTGSLSNSGGSYGVGHLAAFSASDLHYILYGGITEDSRKTMTGHAILASHITTPDTANCYPPPLLFTGTYIPKKVHCEVRTDTLFRD